MLISRPDSRTHCEVIMKLYKCVICSVMITFFLVACAVSQNTSNEKDSPNVNGSLFYLSLYQNKIYELVLPVDKEADIIYSPPQDSDKEYYEINSLNCGPGGELLFHLRHTSIEKPELLKKTNQIVTYNTTTKKIINIMVGSESMRFPVISSGKSMLAVSDGNSLLVKDLKTGNESRYFEAGKLGGLVVPWSWSPDGKLLAMTVSSSVKIYFFDVQKGIASQWLPGRAALFSPSGQLIAYLSMNYKEIIIADLNGIRKQGFKGNIFTRIEGWIGEDRVVFTRSVEGYSRTRLGIADLKTGKIYDIKGSDAPRISGICFKGN
jgi:hypothetical protein